ncbi:uncharacterized protein SAPINGB_P006039 [Magnusiomyces paraingens]|uniref:Amino acid permease/ SLC12A domain-containing protein n=1 Tax=Magnusiomyces paraingens TaxID=2606893 RepID=A0A5E8C2X7_9ASCO|nr:uncharacterized protein SAPINGB_P006039 [Saprochaete ingens]VVT58104.1 unnamed protein product [Saprochaete ingens]
MEGISTYTKPTAEGQVKRELKPRHISMIALGGTIGTGLFIGTGSALKDAGPVGSIIAYVFMSTIVYSIAQSIGEMATFIPITGSFTVFCTRFVSPAIGAAIGWMYWFSWAVTFAIELSIVGKVIEYWTDIVPLAAWIAIFFTVFTAVNFFPVKIYGEVEFWAASIKVIAVVGWLIYALCMMCGASKIQGPIGFKYWGNPGAWGPGILTSNIFGGRILGFLSALINAAFTFQGTELVGITAGECANPRKAVPRAINRVFFRIVVFFLGSIFFMGILVPYNDRKLVSNSSFTSSSPFVIAIINCGTSVLGHIFNAVILTTILSAGNSNVYIGSRLLYALGSAHVGPRFLTRTTENGVPWVGVLFTSVFGLLGFLSVSSGSQQAFEWLVNVSTVAGLLSWAAISFSHIRFIKALDTQEDFCRDDLPFKASGGIWYAWYAFVCVCIIVVIQGFTCFWDFTAASFLTAYISLFIFVILFVVFQFFVFCGPLLIKPEDIDIMNDCYCQEELNVPVEKKGKLSWYERVLDAIF